MHFLLITKTFPNWRQISCRIFRIILSSWGSGANAWGPEKDEKFTKPNHWDGMLEVVGVQGVVHLGQIQSGLRAAIRIVQGSHIKIHMNCDVPVQVCYLSVIANFFLNDITFIFTLSTHFSLL